MIQQNEKKTQNPRRYLHIYKLTTSVGLCDHALHLQKYITVSTSKQAASFRHPNTIQRSSQMKIFVCYSNSFHFYNEILLPSRRPGVHIHSAHGQGTHGILIVHRIVIVIAVEVGLAVPPTKVHHLLRRHHAAAHAIIHTTLHHSRIHHATHALLLHHHTLVHHHLMLLLL